MPSFLHAFLEGEASKRGWSLNELARQADIQPSTISKIKQSEYQPSLTTLVALSQALGLPLGRLVEACGYPVNLSGPMDEDAQAAALVRAVPEAAEFVAALGRLRSEDRQAVLVYARMLAKHHAS